MKRPLAAAILLLAASASAASNPPLYIVAPRWRPGYLPGDARFGVAPRTLRETPASLTVLEDDVLEDVSARTAARAAALVPSASENYAPLGYYESFSLRGFTLDNASGYLRNGLRIANEASMPLENKARVEILAGPAGIETGAAAAGGLFDYETKRPTPAPLRVLSAGGGATGGRHVRADFGGSLGPKALFGWRVNAAHERYRPYVREAEGDRSLLSVRLELKSPAGPRLWFDADRQRRTQLTVPGYQALGGRSLPADPDPRRMLNDQAWSAPVRTVASNVGGGAEFGGTEDRTVLLRANSNRIGTDDNAAFPYGCTQGAFVPHFCSDGGYDLYDYRSPGESRRAFEAQGILRGRLASGGLVHRPALAVSWFRRAEYRGKEVYEYVGSANINDPAPRVFAPSPLTAGPVRLTRDYRDAALALTDTLSLGENWRLTAGLRASRLSERRASRFTGAEEPGFSGRLWTPRAALVFLPAPDCSVYAAYTEGVELGGTAPATAANAGRMLDPKTARQWEAGGRARLAGSFDVRAAVFLIRKPHEFLDSANALVQRGRASHAGAELAWTGSPWDRTRTTGGLTFLRARLAGTGEGGLDGRTPVNVPALKIRVSAEREADFLSGLALGADWDYVSSKYARSDNSLSVPGYHLFGLSARFEHGLWGGRLAWRLRAENVLDRSYWKDAGRAFGDGYLHLGAPRTFFFSVTSSF